MRDLELLEQLANTHRFRLGRPSGLSFTSPRELLFLRSGPRSFVRALYALDLESGDESELLTAEAVLGGLEETLTDAERARRERLRLSERGLTAFTVLADGRLLLPLSARLYVYDRARGETRVVGAAAPGAPMDARPAPGGGVFAVHDGELWLHALDGPSRRLTRRLDDDETWGLPEFVAEEEMHRHRGYWPSPDGRHVLVQRTRTTGVERLWIHDVTKPERPPRAMPYPRAGRTNADVEVAILELSTGGETWVRWDRDAWPYLATARWEPGAPPTLVLQDRRQQALRVVTVDVATGAVRDLFREEDDAWLNLDQDYPRWLPDGRALLWATERDGAWQVELRDAEGTRLGAVTPTGLGYQGLVGVDARRGELWVRASPDPSEAHVWCVPLDVASKPLDALARLTTTPGLHAAVPGPRFERFAVVSQPRDDHYRVAVVDRRGAEVRPVRVTQERPPRLPRLEITRVEPSTTDVPALDTLVLRPRDFDPTLRYPVIVSVYGGPHVRMVNASASDYVLQQWIADQGFCVVVADGRGTPHRGRAFERALRGSFVDVPLGDQVAALEALLARHPELDGARVGIYGWSFGGYLSTMAALRRPDVFKTAVAGAPVTDWLDYDTHYTERYVGLPSEAPEAYVRSSAFLDADTLSVPLLLVHGTTDDNVYFAHSQKLSDVLFRAGCPHELLALANFTHMVADPTVTVRLYARIIGWFRAHLGAPRPR